MVSGFCAVPSLQGLNLLQTILHPRCGWASRSAQCYHQNRLRSAHGRKYQTHGLLELQHYHVRTNIVWRDRWIRLKIFIVTAMHLYTWILEKVRRTLFSYFGKRLLQSAVNKKVCIQTFLASKSGSFFLKRFMVFLKILLLWMWDGEKWVGPTGQDFKISTQLSVILDSYCVLLFLLPFSFGTNMTALLEYY